MKNTFILVPKDALIALIKDHPEEIKLAFQQFAFQQDESLIDEAGNVWRLQTRSHAFRPPDESAAVHLQVLRER